MTKVSIIVPCRNGETYLAACIESIVAQTFKDFELLLIDDGSSDKTPEIMREIAARDGRLRIFEGPGRGVSAARNLGLGEAHGEWVFFVDADDLLPERALETLMNGADDPDTDMIIGAHETFGEEMETVLFWPETRWYRLPWPKKRRAMALRLIEGDSILNIMCNKLHRRSFLKENGIRLCENVRVAEDSLFNLEAVLLSHGCRYCHAVTYRYRMHARSTMNQADGSAFDLHEPWLQAMREMLVRRGCFEAYYGAFVDSVTLRLYKDGGIGGVVHTFDEKAPTLTAPDELDTERMSPSDRRKAALIASGRYARIYPLDAVRQIAVRKAGEAWFALRRSSERRSLARTEAQNE